MGLGQIEFDVTQLLGKRDDIVLTQYARLIIELIRYDKHLLWDRRFGPAWRLVAPCGACVCVCVSVSGFYAPRVLLANTVALPRWTSHVTLSLSVHAFLCDSMFAAFAASPHLEVQSLVYPLWTRQEKLCLIV